MIDLSSFATQIQEQLAIIPSFYSEGDNVRLIRFTDGHCVTFRRQLPRALARKITATWRHIRPLPNSDGTVRPWTEEEEDALEDYWMLQLLCFIVEWDYRDASGVVLPVAVSSFDLVPHGHVEELIKQVQAKEDLRVEDAKSQGADSGDIGLLQANGHQPEQLAAIVAEISSDAPVGDART